MTRSHRPLAARLSAFRFPLCSVLSVSLWFAGLCNASAIHACPFCNASEPTLAERRESAVIATLAEVATATNDAGLQSFTIHRVLKGSELLGERRELIVRGKLQPGTLAILFGSGDDDELTWYVTAVDETSLSYFARSPALRVPQAERLAYFVPYFEHANPLIAQDAYAEFGRAPYDAVTAVADKLPMDKMRAWLVDRAVPEERKGFYGMALGLAKQDDERRQNRELLWAQITAQASDFRSGFDGMLGGYLLLTAESGLVQLEQRLLTPRDAPRGDVVHAITALRFYHEYGKQIPAARLSAALAQLVERPEYAATVLVDLARWQAWEIAPRVARLWDQPGFAERPTRRAIVGYLRNCPTPVAQAALVDLRKRFPDEVSDAEQTLNALGGVR